MPLSRQLFILTMVALVVMATLVCAGYAGATTPTAFYPDADARVDSANPNANFGTSVSLRVGSTQETFIRFSTYDLVGPTERAVLRMWVTNGTVDGPAVYATSSDWGETTITWANRPARIGDPLDDKGALGGNTWVEFDLTSLVNGIGTFSFALVQPGSDSTHFMSREGDASKRPMLVVSTTGISPSPSPTSTPTPTPTPAATPTVSPPPTASPTPPSGGASLIGAGDIADGGTGAAQTELLLDSNPDAFVVALGDLTYDGVDLDDPNSQYAVTWGRHKDRTFPVLGNHDYHGTPPARKYFDYWGDAAGPRGGDLGYYAFNAGAWRVYVLNSNCERYAHLCDPNGAQLAWLREDLAANPRQCSMAMFHHPYYTGGVNNMNPALRNIWVDLWNANVDVVLNGHSHRYERYHPQDVDGFADSLRGIRQFTVGTGGAFFQGLGALQPNLAVRQNTEWGVIRFDLHDGAFDYRYITVAGGTFADSGQGIGCH